VLWLLPWLVVILVLGHVCELPAYAELVSHHHSDAAHHSSADSSEGEPGLCDAVTASSTSGQLHHVWTGLAVVAILPAVAAPPAGWMPPSFEAPSRLASRVPLFLLHSSFLI
jgi:hypothetical protein